MALVLCLGKLWMGYNVVKANGVEFWIISNKLGIFVFVVSSYVFVIKVVQL